MNADGSTYGSHTAAASWDEAAARVQSMCRIDILLATFNGAGHLPALLESLEHQTHSAWRLIARDDGSTDSTTALIEAWGRRESRNLELVEDHRGGLGACANFGALLDASDGPYFMFCDQDDVWLPSKMAALLHAIRLAEAEHGADTPILVHSDLVVVDDALKELHPSFWRYQRLSEPSARLSRKRLLLQNYVVGCALIGNAALREAARPIPSEALMHDWWIALVAANLGKIVDYRLPTVLYRQHGRNAVGAKPWGLGGVVIRLMRDPLGTLRRARAVIQRSQQQARRFAEIFSDRLDLSVFRLYSEYGRLRSATFWRRKMFPIEQELLPSNWLHAVKLWWLL